VAKDHARWGRCTTPNHVLVGATDVRRHDLEDDAVIDGLSCGVAEGRKVDLLNFDATGLEINNASVGIGRYL